MPLSDLTSEVIRKHLDEYTNTLLTEAKAHRDNKKVEIDNVENIGEIVENNKYAIAY
jgi:hypothetical protein